MAEPVGYNCPGCGQHALMALAGGEQAFCGNDECHVLSWNPTLTLEELATKMDVAEWRAQ